MDRWIRMLYLFLCDANVIRDVVCWLVSSRTRIVQYQQLQPVLGFQSLQSVALRLRCSPLPANVVVGKMTSSVKGFQAQTDTSKLSRSGVIR
jgi:hypothetical protein